MLISWPSSSWTQTAFWILREMNTNVLFTAWESTNKNNSPSPKFSLLIWNIHGRTTYYYYFFNKFIYLFIYFWLCWVFVSVQGPSPVAASGVHSSSRCAGLSLSRPLLVQSTGSRRAGSVVVVHGPSRSAACGIFPDRGTNPRPLHRQADSQPLRHQGSPIILFVAVFQDIPDVKSSNSTS